MLNKIYCLTMAPFCRFVLTLHGRLTARAAKSTGCPLQDSVLPVPLPVISRLVRPVATSPMMRTNPQKRRQKMIKADFNNTISRRIVEITTEDDDMTIDFLDLDFDILRRHP
jgi:hypothetical protein